MASKDKAGCVVMLTGEDGSSLITPAEAICLQSRSNLHRWTVFELLSVASLTRPCLHPIGLLIRLPWRHPDRCTHSHWHPVFFPSACVFLNYWGAKQMQFLSLLPLVLPLSLWLLFFRPFGRRPGFSPFFLANAHHRWCCTSIHLG